MTMEDTQPGAIIGLGLSIMFLYGMLEMLWLALISKQVSFKHDFWQSARNVVIVVSLSSIPLFSTAGFGLLGQELAPLQLGMEWYYWPLGLLIYEFWYWVQHFLAHKVRLLWCLHSPHHAPDTINMVVGYNHHMLEVPYMAFFMGFVPTLCGVPAEMVIVINGFDMIWGSMLHASPRVIKRRYGILEYFMQTPSYHRAHHAKNPRYMDTNYNATTLFWDWALGTLQPLRDDEPVEYGITRDVNVESWRDVQFGEMSLLWQDIKNAPDLKSKLGYTFCPPGWSHVGDHKMASTQKLALEN